MPIAIHPHLTFDDLLASVGSLETPQTPTPLPVVVPSVPFQNALQQQLADRFGISMGRKFWMPQDFVRSILGKDAVNPWSKKSLVWRILSHVHDFSDQLGIMNPSSRDQFAVASLLADQLDQYAHFRPEMIQAWNVNRPFTRSESEVWQRDLWKHLNDEIVAETNILNPAIQLLELQKDVPAQAQLAKQFPKLLVLGVGVLNPLLIRALGILAEAGSDVEVRIILPSQNYLGDLWRRKAFPNDSIDLESFDAQDSLEIHPLWQSLGRQAIGSFLLLGQLDEQYTHWPEPNSQQLSESSLPLLKQIQNDLRVVRYPEKTAVDSNNSSIQVHSCFGPRRELETIRDEILRAFEEIPDLRPHEIHIVTPDLKTYAHLISAVFHQGNNSLPILLSESSSSETNPLLDALLSLLSMAYRGQFNASEVLELLQKLAVQMTLGIDDDALIRRWLVESGLTHGLEETEIGSANFALNRLLAGRFFPNQSAAMYPDGNFVLPVTDPLGVEIELRSRFHSWLNNLKEIIEDWLKPTLASDWESRLKNAIQCLLQGAQDEFGADILRSISFLSTVESKVAVDAGAILDWLQDDQSPTLRRTHTAGSIAFGQLKQLQNLPCRVLIMVGMQDSKFPAKNRQPAWDLLRLHPRVWDRNERLNDHQLFLDAILTPKDRLIITGSTQNIHTKKIEPFSSCVEELLRTIEDMGGKRPVIRHRLQPFVIDYYQSHQSTPDNTLPRSYNTLYAEVAKKLYGDREIKENPFWWSESESNKVPEFSQLSLSELIRFWKDPAKAFIKACRISLPQEVSRDEDLDYAPFPLNGLQIWKLKDCLMTEMLMVKSDPDREKDLTLLKARGDASRLLPPKYLSQCTWDATKTTIQSLAETVREVSGEKISLTFDVGNLCLTGEFTLSLDGQSLIAYSYKLLEALKKKKPKDFLGFWMVALLASATGHSIATQIFTPTDPMYLTAKDSKEFAQETLKLLIEGFLQGQQRPLRFDLNTSAKLLPSGKKLNATAEELLQSAKSEWFHQPYNDAGGAGLQPAAQLAWQGRDPFDDLAEWEKWAQAISKPLKNWTSTKRK